MFLLENKSVSYFGSSKVARAGSIKQNEKEIMGRGPLTFLIISAAAAVETEDPSICLSIYLFRFVHYTLNLRASQGS